MNILALHNLKGGVGKTAAAVNLAWEAGRAGWPTLVWDLDAQGAASWYLGADGGFERKAKKLLGGKSPLGREVRPTPHDNVDVLPADQALHELDDLLRRTADSRKHLGTLLEPFAEQYALVVLDCPPGLSRFAEQVARAADRVLVPVVPSPLSLRAWTQMREHLGGKKSVRRRLSPFFSLVDRRRRLHRDWLAEPPAAFEGLMAGWVPYASVVERMGLEQAPVGTFAPRSAAARAYAGLWAEVAAGFGR
ncbi:Sporulation initiation inhibitor protein Soj [wastewater metagenome]|uniref:Sporulation initiation inhibitor protein Soj n=3 Tax=root TaxID=1 RepID=A0A5B8RIZ4_9ZZZZ|nr:ParA family protein [Arhodomonas aquaeolei]MCS4503505.1 ParA family protein [Arhodomonas aquaeolei]QEA07534.1 sporulation initiation inhibitor protein Soj [uncultured organism]